MTNKKWLSDQGILSIKVNMQPGNKIVVPGKRFAAIEFGGVPLGYVDVTKLTKVDERSVEEHWLNDSNPTTLGMSERAFIIDLYSATNFSTIWMYRTPNLPDYDRIYELRIELPDKSRKGFNATLFKDSFNFDPMGFHKHWTIFDLGILQ